MKLSKKKKFAILAAVAAGFNFSAHVFASETDYINYDGKRFVQFELFNKGEFIAQYTPSEFLKDAVKSGTSYWTGILGPRFDDNSLWQIAVVTQKNYQNAWASTISFKDRQQTIDSNYVAQMLQGKRTLNYFDMKELANVKVKNADDEEKLAAGIIPKLPDGTIGMSIINVGQHLGANREGAIQGWWIDADTVLPTNEQAADFIGTIRHELGHALGIMAQNQYCDWNGNILSEGLIYGTNKYLLTKFGDNIDNENSWSAHLIDKNGNHAKPGMFIVSSVEFEKLKSENSNITESDYFIVDAGNFAYFVGDNVTEALDGAKFNGISGLPVNTFEQREDGTTFFEGSHLQTSGIMSRRAYSNYTSFMEVELAAMQDLGYDFDRKAYFGYSVYGNNRTFTNYSGYSARNSTSTAYTSYYSQIPLGVGLHVYGSNNDITQGSNILTRGNGAVGIRVDGEGNTITIPATTKIHADGYRGKGILFSYGRNQNLNLYGNVTAKGEGGNAIEFNFGSSSNGAADEYRGSYIRYVRSVDEKTGNINIGRNLPLTAMDNDTYNSSTDELNGEMITDFNLSGKIFGLGNAIYIGKNAFVKNININNGAEINGNITSDWKNFSEADGFSSKEKVIDAKNKIRPLYIQYNGKNYIYNKYIPDLVTNLNFNNKMAYSGNISGAENIKLNILCNELVYGGTADILNVTVEKGAGLFGGTFNLNDVSSKISADFSDDTTGKFYNHGTIGSAYSNKSLTINGDLISDGTLRGYGGGSLGNIIVNGKANVEGSTISAVNLELDKSMNVLTAAEITGTIANPEDNPTAISGLLSGYGEISGNQINYKTKISNNVVNPNAEQNIGFNGVKNMSLVLSGNAKKSELLPLYSFDIENAGRALAQIGNSAAVNLLTAAQQSTVVNRVISERLTEAFSANTINFNVGSLNYSDGEENILMGIKANYEEVADNNFWVKFTKHWGELQGGADYHGSAISGGYDRALGKYWRTGSFFSYNVTTLSSENSIGNAYDARGGIYFGYHNDVDDSFLYIDVGKIHNKLSRSISTLGLAAEAKYHSNVLEVGGEYKRNLTPEKSWNVSPYINFQYSHLRQDAYNDTGAGIFNQQMRFEAHSYIAGQLGFEFKRVFDCGNYAARFGVKQAFKGATPELGFTYEGDVGHLYTIKNSQSRTHFVLSIGGENNFGSGWIFGGDVGFQKGIHDKDITASVMLRKIW